MIENRKGFVLIAVLWLLVALGAVGLDAALRSRERNLSAANVVDGTRQRAAAQAGLELVRSRLAAATQGRELELRRATRRAREESQSEPLSLAESQMRTVAGDPWQNPKDLIPDSYVVGDLTCRITVLDGGAKLNLGSMDIEALRRFLGLGLKLEYSKADRLAQAIIDWRDQDDLPGLAGAERADYLEKGARVLPRNSAFQSIDELRHVTGMTDAVFNQAKLYLQVFGAGRVNINEAPYEVLVGLPGMTSGIAEEWVRRRKGGVHPNSRQEFAAVFPAIEQVFRTNPGFEQAIGYLTNRVEVLVEVSVAGIPLVTRERAVVGQPNAISANGGGPAPTQITEVVLDAGGGVQGGQWVVSGAVAADPGPSAMSGGPVVITRRTE